MKIIFNDATELVVQSALIRTDGSLLIKTISATEEELRTMFQDKFKTQKMVVTERESTLGEYENYTNMDAIVKYTAGITGVILYKVGETPAEKTEALASENAELKKTVDMLKECILEMSELVYQ
ncbi:hypothetical protein LI249_13145 [Dorea formicigenerans]|uniref:hypothetical protein n=1 Tax=Dorea formicigenerans TaxID=39486 RepID=UPI001D0892C4|nr:hypothetical protein [Dorea formicigenerans]MCB6284389.1 hypothetical protein [Dorea formicigenerans]MCB6381451.1 hypothetical protein [Dorea formicigenerans]MCB6384434.1 hypothetical protein [Dorea formicigenerans]MCB6389606.1 hypothetical protein [Dorea formicigenerans]MCB6392896.1 hypothetical protein [Dorea formicigenerans]